jgi:hypothetical protein
MTNNGRTLKWLRPMAITLGDFACNGGFVDASRQITRASTSRSISSAVRLAFVRL